MKKILLFSLLCLMGIGSAEMAKASCVMPTINITTTATTVTINWSGDGIIGLGIEAYGTFVDGEFNVVSGEIETYESPKTIIGLEPNTQYTIVIIGLCYANGDGELDSSDEMTLTFVTEADTGIEQISNEQLPMTNKILMDGHLYLMRDGKIFNAQGAQVR